MICHDPDPPADFCEMGSVKTLRRLNLLRIYAAWAKSAFKNGLNFGDMGAPDG
jgi:hypothetical protein